MGQHIGLDVSLKDTAIAIRKTAIEYGVENAARILRLLHRQYANMLRNPSPLCSRPAPLPLGSFMS